MANIGFTFGGWLRTLASSRGQLQAAMDEAGHAAAVAGHNPHSD